jgi:RNA polymerase sigma factor (sigma-70 family)
MTDKEIIEHLRHNKYSLAVKGLYNILPDVKQYIKANSGTAADAEDILQDALVILYKKIHSGDFVLTSSLKTYLLAIVKNCWLQQLRQQKKMPAGEIIHDIPAAETNEEPALTLADTAFNLLGEKCKQLLILFYFKKESFKTIATTLGFSDEKVAKNQKYRCIQKAKEHYLTLSKNGSHE